MYLFYINYPPCLAGLYFVFFGRAQQSDRHCLKCGPELWELEVMASERMTRTRKHMMMTVNSDHRLQRLLLSRTDL